jgi:DNA repair ATPase RecN
LAKDVHRVKEPKLKKLVPKMKEAQQQLSTLSELITQPGNDISEIMSRLKLKEKDVSRLEEYVQAEQEIVKEYRGKKEDYFEKMKQLEKEIINSDNKTLMEYFQLSKKKQNLHEAVLDLKSALGQIAM